MAEWNTLGNRLTDVVGSNPTLSISFILVKYGIRLSAFFDIGHLRLRMDGTLLSFVSILECTQNGDAE